MPWPTFQNMTDRDIRAIYEYLSAIPCLEGDPGCGLVVHGFSRVGSNALIGNGKPV
jgi:hypothetical protein